MSEQSTRIRPRVENSPPASSGPIITFHGAVHGFTYSASPQGNLICCMMVNHTTSTSSCDTRRADSFQNVRRGNGTNRGTSESPTANQASDSSSSSSPRYTSTDTPTTPGDRTSPSGNPTFGGLATSDVK